MRTVPVTRYTLPDGKRSYHYIPVTDALGERADALIVAKHAFTVEEIRTGETSYAVEDENNDIEIQLVKPGASPEEHRDAFATLIDNAYKIAFGDKAS